MPKKEDRKGKKVRKGRKHEKTHVYKYYEIKDGALTRKKKSCPRCGPGTWLAGHKNRTYCGKCGYTEFDRRTEEHAKK